MLNENKIADAIREEGFSTHTIALIDNYISQIFNRKKILLIEKVKRGKER